MPSFNAQVKKNSIAFDIDFENIKQNVLTTKKEDKSPKKIEVIPNVEDPNEEQKEQILYKCPNCDRKFKRESYAKHVPICARVFNNNNNKNMENNKEKDKDKKNDKKRVFNKKAKWENQSDELRAIIQQKREEKAEDNHIKKELKIEIEEDKRHSSNKIVITQTNEKEGYTRDGIYYQCNLCNKKFTKMNYESHLHDCKQKHKEKKNLTFNNRPNISLMNNNNNPSSPTTRQPTLPAVTYGGYSKKPNLNLKFGKY
jgi:ribosomal protein L37AE/L43A